MDQTRNITKNSSAATKVDQFFQSYPQKTLKKGDILLHPGDNSSHIYFLKSGLVQEYLENLRGENLMLHFYRPGAFFAVKWIFTNGSNDLGYEIKSESVIFECPIGQFSEFIHKNPDVMWLFMEKLLGGLDLMMKRFGQIALDPSTAKLASILYFLATSFGKKEQNKIVITLPITHRELASWVGVTRETITMELLKMAKQGIVVKENKHLAVKNLKKLEDLVNSSN